MHRISVLLVLHCTVLFRIRLSENEESATMKFVFQISFSNSFFKLLIVTRCTKNKEKTERN